MVGREKGIDVRLALDILLLGFRRDYDVAVVFIQDQDLSEVADEIRILAKSQNRWIKIVSAFPTSPTSKNRRGINGTDWVKIDRETYASCIDPRDYRPKKQPPSNMRISMRSILTPEHGPAGDGRAACQRQPIG